MSEALPHLYECTARSGPEGGVIVDGRDVPALETAAPPQFGGPGGRWSPETLLVAAAVDCFVLTFRAIAAASKLPWRSLSCQAQGILDRVEDVTRFTELRLHAALTLPADGDADRAARLLEKAEKTCLVTNSLRLAPTLHSDVTIEA